MRTHWEQQKTQKHFFPLLPKRKIKLGPLSVGYFISLVAKNFYSWVYPEF
jgi:hypothetical protein